MTGLGAGIYLGFFAVAALWLFITSDFFAAKRHVRAGGVDTDDQIQRPVFSNSINADDAAESFSPDLVTHASSK